MRRIKTTTFSVFFCLLLAQTCVAQQTALPVQNAGELKLIRQTLEDYIEGSTNGQPERLKTAFHEDLNLYSIKKGQLQVWSGKDYIADTKQGQPTGEIGSILSIDFENDTAVAKVEIAPPRGTPYVDYFMLLKIKKKWTIVHKMYTRRNGKAASDGEWSRARTGKETNKQPAEPKTPTKEDQPGSDSEGQKTKDDKEVSVIVASEIDKLFAAYQQLDTPGCALTVLKGGETVFQKGYGAANLEHRVPIDAQSTVFNIGSVSKQFTAFAVLLLEEDGKLSLNDDVRKHIPELHEFNQPISLKQLAHHTSGIRSELSLLAMAGWTPGDVIRMSHILKMLERQRALNFQPGDSFDYSNSGYTLLAEVVARVSGVSFSQFCKQRILEPLEMQNSSFADGADLRMNIAYSYLEDSAGFFPRNGNDFYSGSGGLWTTCDDLSRWAKNFRAPKVGSPTVMAKMNEIGILNSGKKTGYAMGQMLEDSMRNSNTRFKYVELSKPESKASNAVLDSDTNAAQTTETETIKHVTAETELNVDQLSKEVNDAVKAVLQESNIPGATVVIVKEGKTIHKQGYGFANLETRAPVDPDKTIFRIGSISKALTLLTLARQADQGRIKLDDDVEKYFEGLRNPYEFKRPVTIKHLLTHTSGFDQIGGRDRQIRNFNQTLALRKAARPQLVDYLKANRLRRVSPAGQYYRYDTYGSSLAGAILERITGTLYADAMRIEMFQPLGMTSTAVEANVKNLKRLATGYEKENGENLAQPYEVYVTTPASSIDSTAADMGRLLEALTSDGSNPHGRIFSEQMIEAIYEPQFRPHSEFCGTTHGLHESYVAGSSGRKAARSIDHGGTMAGFSSLMAILPDHKLGVFVVSNQSGGGRNPLAGAVMKAVVDHLPDVSSTKADEVPLRDASADLSAYAGKYHYGVFCHLPTRADMEAGGVWGRGPARFVKESKGALIIGEDEYLPRGEDVFIRTDGQQKVFFGRNDDEEVSFFTYASSPDTFEREDEKHPFPEFESLADVVTQSMSRDGVAAGLNLFANHKDSEDHYLREDEMNNGGYGLLQLGKVGEAIAIFKLNVASFPNSWNAHDSLGEAYAAAGKTELAIASYSESIKLNPDNVAGKAQLKKLKKVR